MNELDHNIIASASNDSISQSYAAAPPSSYADDKLSSLLIEFRELSERVKALYLKEAEKETQLPIEIIQPIIERKFIRKRLNRPLLEGEIRHAISISKTGNNKTMEAAARYLEVSSKTLKKYCEFYDSNSGGTASYVPLWKATRGRKSMLP